MESDGRPFLILGFLLFHPALPSCVSKRKRRGRRNERREREREEKCGELSLTEGIIEGEGCGRGEQDRKNAKGEALGGKINAREGGMEGGRWRGRGGTGRIRLSDEMEEEEEEEEER